MYEFLHDARLAQRPKSKSLKLFLLSISHQNDIPKLYFTFLNANQFREKIFLLVWCHSSEIEIYALWNCLAKCFQICHIFLNKKTQIVFFSFRATLPWSMSTYYTCYIFKVDPMKNEKKKTFWVFLFQKYGVLKCFARQIHQGINLLFLKSDKSIYFKNSMWKSLLLKYIVQMKYRNLKFQYFKQANFFVHQARPQ